MTGNDPPRKRLLQRVEEEVRRKDAEGGETVAAARLPRAHIAVIDSQAKVLGINRSEMIRRILADWTVRIVKDEEDGFAPFDDVAVIGVEDLRLLRFHAYLYSKASKALGQIHGVTEQFNHERFQADMGDEERNDG